MKKILTEADIKKDLKNLRYFSHTVRIYENASEFFREQYESAKAKNILSDRELKEMETCLKLMESNITYNQNMALRQKYIEYISELDELSKAIMIDAFINGCTYSKIATKLYCSIETVKRRVKSSLIVIRDKMNLSAE